MVIYNKVYVNTFSCGRNWPLASIYPRNRASAKRTVADEVAGSDQTSLCAQSGHGWLPIQAGQVRRVVQLDVRIDPPDLQTARRRLNQARPATSQDSDTRAHSRSILR